MGRRVALGVADAPLRPMGSRGWPLLLDPFETGSSAGGGIRSPAAVLFSFRGVVSTPGAHGAIVGPPVRIPEPRSAVVRPTAAGRTAPDTIVTNARAAGRAAAWALTAAPHGDSTQPAVVCAWSVVRAAAQHSTRAGSACPTVTAARIRAAATVRRAQPAFGTVVAAINVITVEAVGPTTGGQRPTFGVPNAFSIRGTPVGFRWRRQFRIGHSRPSSRRRLGTCYR